MRQQIVCCLSYNMYATGDSVYAPVYFSLVKQQSITAFRAAAAAARCRALMGFPDAALGAEPFGTIWFFPLPVVLSSSTERDWHNRMTQLNDGAAHEQDKILFFPL